MNNLKVFGVPWHVGHQYEIAKMFGWYDLLVNPYRTWGESSRPMPKNVSFVNEFKPGKYDFALLHIDQQCIYNPSKGDRISKGKLFIEVRDTIRKLEPKLPVIVINHMTPFHDKYEPDYVVNYFKEATDGMTMVVNTYEAAKQWGWGNTIVHGMDADQWWDLPKEPRAITVLTPGGMEKAYRRIFLHTVKRYLGEMGVPFVWVGVDKKFSNFDDYRQFIGRSLLYFNPTWQSPRPRSRTEAMLSGCCIVTTPYQDADTYIKEGENGFLTSRHAIKDPRVMDNPRYTADLIKRLVIDEPDLALSVGKKGKLDAKKLFSHENFAKQWETLLKKIQVI